MNKSRFGQSAGLLSLIACVCLASTAQAADFVDLPEDIQAEIARLCLPSQFSDGADAYRLCLRGEALARDSEQAKPSIDLSFDDKAALQAACGGVDALSSEDFGTCINEQIDALSAEPLAPIELLDADERFALRQTCADIQQSEGAVAYRQCLNEQIATLETLATPTLDGLNPGELNALHQACSDSSADVVEYRRCLVDQVGGEQPALVATPEADGEASEPSSDAESAVADALASTSAAAGVDNDAANAIDESQAARELPVTESADADEADARDDETTPDNAVPEEDADAGSAAVNESGSDEGMTSMDAFLSRLADGAINLRDQVVETVTSLDTTGKSLLAAALALPLLLLGIRAASRGRDEESFERDYIDSISDEELERQMDLGDLPETDAPTRIRPRDADDWRAAARRMENAQSDRIASFDDDQTLLRRPAVSDHDDRTQLRGLATGQDRSPRFAASDDDDRTQLRIPGAEAGGRETSSDTIDEDRTELRLPDTDDDRTQLRMPNVDDDRTELRSFDTDDDRTRLRLPSEDDEPGVSQPADDDRTRLQLPDDDDDRTRLRATDEDDNRTVLRTPSDDDDHTRLRATDEDDNRTVLRTPSDEAEKTRLRFASQDHGEQDVSESAQPGDDDTPVPGNEGNTSSPGEALGIELDTPDSKLPASSTARIADPGPVPVAVHESGNDSIHDLSADYGDLGLGDLSLDEPDESVTRMAVKPEWLDRAPARFDERHEWRSDFGRWLNASDETTRLQSVIEFLIYWMAYGDERYDSKTRDLVLSRENPDHHDLIKRWVLQEDHLAFAEATRWMQDNSTATQRGQTIDLLMVLLVTDGAITPVQNLLLRFLSDAFGLGEDELDLRYQRAFGEPLPALPRVDKPTWWQQQDKVRMERWDSLSTRQRPEHEQYRIRLGLDLRGELDERDISDAFRRAARRCHPDRFSALGVREQSLAKSQFRKLEQARDRLLGVGA